MNVCDVCLHENKLVKATCSTRIPRIIKIDLCEKHKNSVPKKNIDFVIWGNKLQGRIITEEEAKFILRI